METQELIDHVGYTLKLLKLGEQLARKLSQEVTRCTVVDPFLQHLSPWKTCENKANRRNGKDDGLPIKYVACNAVDLALTP